MKQQLILLLFTFVLIEVKSNVIKIPLEYIDITKEHLDILDDMVRSSIAVAHADLLNIEYDFLSNSQKILNDAGANIIWSAINIEKRLTLAKSLAEMVYKLDVSSCTDGQVDILFSKPQLHIDKMKACVFDIFRSEAGLMVDSRYIVDVAINKVLYHEFNMNQCNGDLQCISPVRSEIELDKIRLPQNIRSEVDVFNSVLATLQPAVQNCLQVGASEYRTAAYALEMDITDCIYALIADSSA